MIKQLPLITFLLVLNGYNDLDNRSLYPASSFVCAWENPLRPIIIDAYGPNPIDWEKMQTDERVVGIIHKASEGFRIDGKYESRRKKAKKLGYKWGAYHLGRAGKPVQQADFYLESINYKGDELLALDLETVDGNKYMNLKEAIQFINRIHEKTHRYPLLYCNHKVLKEITKRYGPESVFAKCPLWYARFRKDIPNFDNSVWDTYSLWQFSSEINCNKTNTCLYNVPGTAYDMDVNVYNGSIMELEMKWPDL